MSKAADIVNAVWIVFVGIVYYGGYFWPSIIGVYTTNLGAVYALMVIFAVVGIWLRVRGRLPGNSETQSNGKRT